MSKIIFIFLTTLGVRLFVLSLVPENPVVGDEQFYNFYGRNLAHGTFEVARPTYEETYILPVWPRLLAIPYSFSDSETSGRLLAVLIAAMTSVFLFFLTRDLFGTQAATVACYMYAFFPDHVFFSHLLYAEIPLEFFMVVFAFLFFRASRPLHSRWETVAAYFVLGVGLLCKHFAVVPFAASLFVLRKKDGSAWKFIPALAFFVAPLIYFSSLALEGRDEWKFFNVPIKNAHEWYGEGWFDELQRNPDTVSKTKVLESYFDKKIKLSVGYELRKSAQNILNLWSPDSYPIQRLKHHYGMHNPSFWILIIVVAHTLLLAAGLIGFILSPPSKFKKFSFFTIVILSGMSILWWLVSRYRVPFMFFFIINAAYLFTPAKTRLHFINSRQKILCASALLVVGFITYWGIHKIGRWG